MRTLALVAAALLALAGLTPASASGDLLIDLKPGGFMSANVDYVGTIPIDSPGVGARVVKVGAQTRLYVTGVRGLTIYDVTNPALPVPLGHIELPVWQNEDVDVSADGRRVLISGDSFGTMFTYIVDASIPAAPRLASIGSWGAHTVSCVDDACNWVYTSEGDTFDLTAGSLVPRQVLPGWYSRAKTQGVVFKQGAHDLNRAADGRVISDTVPRLMLDVADPANPVVLAQGTPPDGARLAYQHNNLRPNAEDWTPRAIGDDGGPYRAGEIMLSNGETNISPFCGGGSGPFATWSVKNFDRGESMQHLNTFRPMNGNWSNGSPPANAPLGCSGHWFSERDGIVAAGWYEHGIRFLDVDMTTGTISEAGFFQPVVTSASAAHWIDDEYVYTVDYERGIDILRFDRGAPRPAAAAIEASWRANARASSPAAEHERLVCRLATEQR